MHWFFIVLAGHLINALSFIVNKYFLGHIKIKPMGYAVLIGLASAGVIALIPFGFHPLPIRLATIALLSGILFIVALYCFFTALQADDVSAIVPVIGGMIPIFTLMLSWWLLRERLLGHLLLGVGALIIGGVCMVWGKRANKRKFSRELIFAFMGAFLFASAFVTNKIVFNETTFINGFIWARFGSLCMALVLLVSAQIRKEMIRIVRMLWSGKGIIFVLGEGMAGVGSVLLFYAMTLISVTIVNALQGVQYVFLLAVSLVLSIFNPGLLKEHFSREVISRRCVGVALIAIGVWLVAL